MGDQRRHRGRSDPDSRSGLSGTASATVTGKKTAVWNHDFLNKKPWHPLNRQNQARIFEAEQEYLDRKKRDDVARAEFEAEQQYLETLAHLPGKEAEKYRKMQGVSWMYIKPPGLTGLQDKKSHDERPGDAGPSRAEPDPKSNSRQHSSAPPQPDAAVPAGQTAEPCRRRGPLKPEERGQGTSHALQVRFQRKAASPPIGGTAAGADCHELLVEEPVDTDAVLAALLMRGERGGSAEPASGRGVGEAEARSGANVQRQRDGGRKESSGRERRRAKRREGQGREDEEQRERSRPRRHDRHVCDGEARGRDGDARRGEQPGSDVDRESGREHVEQKEKGRRSHKEHKHKSKHRSKHDRHKASQRDSPGESGELNKALGYLIEQGVDVSQMVKEVRG